MPLYRLHSAGDSIGNSPSGTRRVLLHAIAKQNNPHGAAYCLANEYICGELARCLRLPAPPVAFVAGEDGAPCAASLDFNLSGQPLPPADMDACLHHLPVLSAGILLFDIWVANPDRHNGNLAFWFAAPDGGIVAAGGVPEGERTPHLVMFDHGQALLGHVAGEALARMELRREALGTASCFLRGIREDAHFAPWVERIRAVPDFFIEAVCREAQPFGLTDAETEAVIAFLKHRRGTLREILHRHRRLLSGLPDGPGAAGDQPTGPT